MKEIKKRDFIREQIESNKEIKENDQKQQRKNIIDEDIELGGFSELATTNKKYLTV